MSFLARILASIAAAMRGTWSFLSDTFDELVDPITKRLPWARDRARAAGRAIDRGVSAAADAAAVTAEVALKAPGVVGREIGSVIASALPSPAVTGRALAEGAVATDEEIQKWVDAAALGAEFERQRPRPGFGLFLHNAVEAYREGGEKALAQHVRLISEPAADWIRSLSDAEIQAALKLSQDALRRHALPERDSDVCPLLPPVVAVAPAPKASASLVSEGEFDSIVAQAKRNLRNSGAEAAAMSKRGPARPEPRFDASEPPAYGRGYRPRPI